MIRSDPVLRTAVVGLFVLACLYSLYFAAEFFLPLTLALILHLVLRPVMRLLTRLRLPNAMAAGLVVLAIVGTLVSGAVYLAEPVNQWVDDLPRIAHDLQRKVRVLREPVDTVMRATEHVEKMTEGSGPKKPEVVLHRESAVEHLITRIPGATFQAFSMLFLLFFLLAYSGEILDRAVELVRTRRNKHELRVLLGTVERVLSRYLATISIINAGLGAAIGGSMYLIGMPTYYLWGVMAALLNFIPYLGSVIGTVVVALVALVSFPTPLHAILAPVAYLACTTVEGQFVTPSILGRSLSLNPIVIFVGVAFWAWIWGPLGALMAVPILIVMKAVFSHVGALRPLGYLIASGDLEEDLPPAGSPGRAR
ncbi:MAG: AI-2E family transporter [Alphaproteobacteria bacterium]|nr:AI-2E family transporter [Alphaproteobacteria bacterium]